MRIPPTVALSLVLLVMMGGAGAASGLWGYALGRESLKSVTQPDVNPAKQLADGQPAPAQTTDDNQELVMLLDEEQILQQVNDIINGQVPADAEMPAEDSTTATEDAAAAAEGNESADAQLAGLNNALPIQGSDQAVTLEVTDAQQDNGSLVLAVNLTNDSNNSVRFLYSFLAVTDDKGRALSAITDGLPSELPANGQAFEGTIKIPLALIEDAQRLSLTLTDYPDQQLELSLTDIPVVE